LNAIGDAKSKAKQAKEDEERKELSKFQVGHQVECQEANSSRWQRGEVTSVSPLLVRPHGSDSAYTWHRVRILEDHELEFKLGQKVVCSDGENDRWRDGEVTQVNPLLVKPAGFIGASLWKLVRAVEDQTIEKEDKRPSVVVCPYSVHFARELEVKSENEAPPKESLPSIAKELPVNNAAKVQTDSKFDDSLEAYSTTREAEYRMSFADSLEAYSTTREAEYGMPDLVVETPEKVFGNIQASLLGKELPADKQSPPRGTIERVKGVSFMEPSHPSALRAMQPSTQAGGPPNEWQDVRRAYFPDSLVAAEAVEILYDENWRRLRQEIVEGSRPWNMDHATLCAHIGEEDLFLNTLEGHVACPEGFCVVFSERNQAYTFLCRSDKDLALVTLPNLPLSREAASIPEGWRDIRKKYFPAGRVSEEAIAAMYDDRWLRLRQKIANGVRLWDMERATLYAYMGEEHLFQPNVEVFKKESCVGVREACDSLNTMEGHVACPEGFCVVHSERVGGYMFLRRSDIDFEPRLEASQAETCTSNHDSNREKKEKEAEPGENGDIVSTRLSHDRSSTEIAPKVQALRETEKATKHITPVDLGTRTSQKIQQVEAMASVLLEEIGKIDKAMFGGDKQDSAEASSPKKKNTVTTLAVQESTGQRFSLKLAAFHNRITELEMQLKEKDTEMKKMSSRYEATIMDLKEQCRKKDEERCSQLSFIQALKKDKEDLTKRLGLAKAEAKAEEDRLHQILISHNIEF